jgi:hypothetical protein
LTTFKKVTFSADPEGLQDKMNKMMHQTMIDQAKGLTNTIQSCPLKPSRKEQKEDIWDLHTYNQIELLWCSNITNRLPRRLMTQQ